MLPIEQRASTNIPNFHPDQEMLDMAELMLASRKETYEPVQVTTPIEIPQQNKPIPKEEFEYLLMNDLPELGELDTASQKALFDCLASGNKKGYAHLVRYYRQHQRTLHSFVREFQWQWFEDHPLLTLQEFQQMEVSNSVKTNEEFINQHPLKQMIRRMFTAFN